MVIRVYAPDSAKHLEEHEKVMQTLKHVMLEGRMEGARRCFEVVVSKDGIGTCMHGGGRRHLKDFYGWCGIEAYP